MKIIDSHAHLNDKQFKDDIDIVIQKAKEIGVKEIYNNADSFSSFQTIMDISNKYPSFCFSVLGIHPEFALNEDDFKKAYDYILENNSKIKAVGEVGLDYHYSKEENLKKKQQALFREQIRLANRLSLPVVIHSRDADYDTYKIIKEEKPIKYDLHCYSGSFEMTQEYLKLPGQFYIGVGGVVTFKNAKTLKEVVINIPIDHILSETDSPYLSPEPNRGKRNDPSNLVYVIKKIAELKEMDVEMVADKLYKNGKEFYE